MSLRPGAETQAAVRSRVSYTTNTPCCGPQVFDAGEMFGIMQVEEVEDEEAEDEAAREARKKQPNPGVELCYKVIVTNENGLQAADPNR